MQLYNKKEFIQLQTPIIFSYYNGGDGFGLYECFDFIKDNNGKVVDYGVVNLLLTGIMPKLDDETRQSFLKRQDIQPNDFGYDYIEDTGNEFELDLNCGQRNGISDDTEMFIVYSKTDLLNLINKLQQVFMEKYTL